MADDRAPENKPPADGTVAMTPPGGGRSRGGVDRLVGQVLDGRYKVRAVLGEGGMGKVYLAEDEKLNRRRVAIKLMGPQLSADPEFRQRFQREALLQANLPHPQIVQVLDTGECSEGTYIAMEYSDGQSLSTLIRELGPRPVDRALDICAQLLEVLDFAHRQRVVHRDLKPSNILIEERAGREFVRVLDFGIAKLISREPGAEHFVTLTKQGSAYGTLGYMAPEQAKGDIERLDHRADLYSLGIILYEMLTGDLPSPREARTHPVRYALWISANPVKPIRETHPDLELAEEIDGIIRSALRREPEKRYASALAFLSAIREFKRAAEVSTIRGQADVQARSTEPLAIGTNRVAAAGAHQSTVLPWAMAAFFFLAAGAGWWMWWQGRGAAPAKVPAELESATLRAAQLEGEVQSLTAAKAVAAGDAATARTELEAVRAAGAGVENERNEAQKKVAELEGDVAKLKQKVSDLDRKLAAVPPESSAKPAIDSGAATDAEKNRADTEKKRADGLQKRVDDLEGAAAANSLTQGAIEQKTADAEKSRDAALKELETARAAARTKDEEVRRKDARIAELERAPLTPPSSGQDQATIAQLTLERDRASQDAQYQRSRVDSLERDLAAERSRRPTPATPQPQPTNPVPSPQPSSPPPVQAQAATLTISNGGRGNRITLLEVTVNPSVAGSTQRVDLSAIPDTTMLPGGSVTIPVKYPSTVLVKYKLSNDKGSKLDTKSETKTMTGPSDRLVLEGN